MQGLYFLYQDNKLVYIGKSVNIPNRLSNHNKKFDSYSTLMIPNEADMAILELAYINYYKPSENILDKFTVDNTFDIDIIDISTLDKSTELDSSLRKVKKIRGGWNMTYAEGYDLVILQLTSKKETLLFLHIKSLFNKANSRVVLSPKVLSKVSGYDAKYISKSLKKLVGLDFIMQLEDKSYLMNPFIVVPIGSDAESLQNEWISIRKSKEYIRRGQDLIDVYKDNKDKYSTFKSFYNALKAGNVTRSYGLTYINKSV
jgi:hypothetical protein